MSDREHRLAWLAEYEHIRTTAGLEELTEEQVSDLEATPVSALDVLVLRTQGAELADALRDRDEAWLKWGNDLVKQVQRAMRGGR